jgi:hypothetical protein
MPADPLDLLANAELVSGVNTDQGVFLDSLTYRTPPTPPNLLKVVGGRVIKSATSTNLAVLQNPISTLLTGVLNGPDRFEIDFNFPPDPPSVTTASFLVTGMTTGPVGGTVVTLPSPTTARLQCGAALGADTYAVQLHGTSTPIITFASVALDGEAIALPSGDGVAGGDFLFGVDVVAGSKPPPGTPPALAPTSNWNSSQIAITSPPTCVALETTNAQMVADAAQWNFDHLTAYLGPTVPTPVNKSLYLRGGDQWRMDIPLSLGYLSYTELQLSILSNIGTRGDCQGTIPAVIFNSRTYSGSVTLRVSLKKLGVFSIGIRAIDTNGYYSMFSSTWNVVA